MERTARCCTRARGLRACRASGEAVREQASRAHLWPCCALRSGESEINLATDRFP